MLIHKDGLREILLQVLSQRLEQGCDLDERTLRGRIDDAKGSYDHLYAIAQELRSPPLREDWPYREPLEWDAIVAESGHLQPAGDWPEPDLAQAAQNVRAAFLASVCGCMLGKPIEVDPTPGRAAAGRGGPG